MQLRCLVKTAFMSKDMSPCSCVEVEDVNFINFTLISFIHDIKNIYKRFNHNTKKKRKSK